MKIISITSGKGGVGKTSLVCNMALGLAQLGKKVLILDGDLGMANVDIFFGVHPQKNLQDFLEGDSLKNVLVQVGQNIDLLPGGNGIYNLCQINAFQRREIINRITEVQFLYDYLLIDTAPGIYDHVLHLNSIADECLVVVTPEPASFTDAYGLIKTLNLKYKIQNFSLVCNQVKDEKHGQQLYLKLSEVIQQFLPVCLNYRSSILFDSQMKLANQYQRLILRQDPKSISSIGIKELCNQIVSKNQLNSSQNTKAHGLDILFGPVSGHA